jgi:cytoskeletal protein RodZ
VWTRKPTAPQGSPLGIGERLRNAREARGYSLAAMERLTKIRADYLSALEEERFDLLPERIYVRGFLRTYALALGFNPLELLDRYDAAYEETESPIVAGRAIDSPIRAATPRSRLRQILGYAVAIVVLTVLLLAYIGVQQLREFSQPAAPPPVGGVGPTQQAPSPTTQPPVGVPSPAPAAPGTPPAPTSPAPSSPLAGVRLELKASGRSWLRIVSDGNRLFEGFVDNGEVHTWTASKQMTVRVGNLPAVAMTLNGQALAPKSLDLVWEGTFTAGQ